MLHFSFCLDIVLNTLCYNYYMVTDNFKGTLWNSVVYRFCTSRSSSFCRKFLSSFFFFNLIVTCVYFTWHFVCSMCRNWIWLFLIKFYLPGFKNEPVELWNWCYGCTAWTDHILGTWFFCICALISVITETFVKFYKICSLWFFSFFFFLQAASNGKFIDWCLEMLVKNFVPPYYLMDGLKQENGVERKNKVLFRVHAAFEAIADLVPLAPLRLSPIVVQRMPSAFSKEPVSSSCTSCQRV